ncbi:zinc finger protein 282-like isoform X2 [Rhinatrema bivittatum]|uniref:zinc finger protein 282-like isoform X2 n=1 Tax=Rhinatrema bivittatum TaxID=194408 RepID=UPI00112C687F|nr:zinc finger protein 282-like isoform X2 [Rhinatrema bivittatum]
MAMPISDLASVIFHDVAVYFSSEEWEVLTDWQKELYRNVMREIHGALVTLGYTIINRGTLLRIKEKAAASRDRDLQDPPATSEDVIDPTSTTGYPVIKPDIYLRVEREKRPRPWTRRSSDDRESTNESSTGCPVFDPELSLWIKQEKVSSPGGQQDLEEEEEEEDEDLCSPRAVSDPCIKPDIFWRFKREERPFPWVQRDSDGKEITDNPSTSCPMLDSELTRWIKQEKALFPGGRPDSEEESLTRPCAATSQPTARPEVHRRLKWKERPPPWAWSNSEAADPLGKDTPAPPMKPPRQAATKRLELKLRDKIVVLQEYEKRKVSMRELAAQFGVSKTQIGQIVKRKEELLTEYLNDASGDRVRRRRRTENDQLNSMVWDWIRTVRAENVALSGAIVKRKALELAEQLGVTEFKASNGWLDSFKRAHNLHQFTSTSCWSQGELR